MFRIDGTEERITGFRTLSTVLIVLTVLVASVFIGGARMDVNRDTTYQATSIDSCTTITEPGAYRLTESIENSTADVCIDIRTSGVHFDGNGHTIDGNVTRQAMIERLGGPTVTEGIGIGVNLDDPSTVSNVTITNVTTTDWFYGVLVRGADDVTVRDVAGTANGIGILVDSATDAKVEQSNGSNNVITGVYVSNSGDRPGIITVVNTTTSDNGRYGVLLFDSPHSRVQDVTATGNAFVGIEVINSSHTTIRNITATENEFRGFGVDALPGHVARNVTVVDNDFGQNGFIGMAVFATTNSTFANNTVVGTHGKLPPERSPPVPSTAIVVDFGSEGNVFADTDARNQAKWAYIADNSGPNTVENLRTDAATVSFDGQNVALGSAATLSENATDTETALLSGGLAVTNTSADAFIDLQTAWETAEPGDQSANETTTVNPTRAATRPTANR